MNIVIVGAGRVGESLAEELSKEGHDIVVIDNDEERINDIFEVADVNGVAGNAVSIEILKAAGIENCDIFIAVSNEDEINIISSIMARKMGAKETIARVRAPEYYENIRFVRNELGITMMINPELEAARSVMNTLEFPAANEVDLFMAGKIQLVSIFLPKNSDISGKALKDINITRERIIISTVVRGEETFIPNGEFLLEDGDKIYIVGTKSAVTEFLEKIHLDENPIKSVMIVGGGDLSYYLTEQLLDSGRYVKIIEIDDDRAEFLELTFDDAIVVAADGTKTTILEEQRIDKYDALVCALSKDEENIVLSYIGENKYNKKTVAKISSDTPRIILQKLALDTVVSPKLVITEKIIRYIRSKINSEESKIISLKMFEDGNVEAIQFFVQEDSHLIGHSLKELTLLPESLILSINRNGNIIYPDGDDVFLEGDHVLVITKQKYYDELEDFLSES